MTPAELNQAVAQLTGGNRTHAARLLGISPRTMREYLAGDRAIPEPVARLARVLVATGEAGRKAAEG